jgi:hypothetical protein
MLSSGASVVEIKGGCGSRETGCANKATLSDCLLSVNNASITVVSPESECSKAIFLQHSHLQSSVPEAIVNQLKSEIRQHPASRT